jgi:hypothetical protein
MVVARSVAEGAHVGNADGSRRVVLSCVGFCRLRDRRDARDPLLNETARRRSIRQPHLNLIRDDARLVTRHANRRILHQRTGRHIELPAVPRARDDGSPYRSLAQRAAAVEAEVVDGVIDAVDIEEADPAPVDVHLPCTARWNLADTRDCDEAHRVEMITASRGTALAFATVMEGSVKDLYLRLKNKQEGAIGYVIMWAMGVPVSVLFLIFLVRGCR